MKNNISNLAYLGFHPENKVFVNLNNAELVEHAIRNNEGVFSDSGALIVDTGVHTGRSASDKFIVDYGSSSDNEIAWGSVNKPISKEIAVHLKKKILDYLSKKNIYVQDLEAGRDARFTLRFRVISEYAWAALFASNLLSNIKGEPDNQTPFTVIHAPDFHADPALDGTVTGTFIIIDFEQRLILIGGTAYAGEIKKSVFTVMNRILPELEVFPMHCSANIGKDGDTALFFGLSGTGKTTLSSSQDRFLIGDDEHGWSKFGIFNFEAGCYAKTIHLKKEQEPLIWEATHRFGTVLENVTYDPVSREINFDDGSKTENTRSAYPLDFIEGHVQSGVGGHPANIFFLSADAFGVLPPISLLSPEQAVFYFLLGYTSKLAGTETGLGNEPLATFSACFGEPFLPLSPIRYAELLKNRLEMYQPAIWLINTGWSGGKFGVGSRIKLSYTRAMIQAALTGELANRNYRKESFFGLSIPENVPGVPSYILDPKNTWSNIEDYAVTVNTLISEMHKQMENYKQDLQATVMNSGPRSII